MIETTGSWGGSPEIAQKTIWLAEEDATEFVRLCAPRHLCCHLFTLSLHLAITMSEKQQRLVLSIIDFLNQSINDGTVKTEDKESLEIAGVFLVYR